MKAVIQRVDQAAVHVDDNLVGAVEKGFLILLGVQQDDREEDARVLAAKVAALRIFTDSNDKMNRSLLDIAGEVLVVSNFTLCAVTKKGTRPSFSHAAEPAKAQMLYELFIGQLRANGVSKVSQGRFGADMKVSILGDGPVTIILDTEEWVNHDSEAVL